MRFPALGKIRESTPNILQNTTIKPFSIALAPSEQKIKATLGFTFIKENKKLKVLVNAIIKRIVICGGGLEIWLESNGIILKSIN